MSIPTFITYQSYTEFHNICENCKLSEVGGACNKTIDEIDECYWEYYTTNEAMKEEDEDYKKQQELRLAKKQEEESAKFYTDNPDFLEV